MLSGPVSDVSRGPVTIGRAMTSGSVHSISAGAVKKDIDRPLGERISDPLTELEPLQETLRAVREGRVPAEEVEDEERGPPSRHPYPIPAHARLRGKTWATNATAGPSVPMRARPSRETNSTHRERPEAPATPGKTACLRPTTEPAVGLGILERLHVATRRGLW